MSPDQTAQAELMLKLLDHKVQSLRVDRHENLRGIGYFGTAIAAFLAFSNLEGMAAINSQLYFGYELRILILTTLGFGLSHFVIVWMYTRALHETELKITANAPRLLNEMFNSEQLQGLYDLTWALWVRWRWLHGIGYSCLALSVVSFLGYAFLAIGLPGGWPPKT